MSKFDDAQTKQKAQELWEKMNDDERTVVRFGMFPAEVMRSAESDGYDILSTDGL